MNEQLIYGSSVLKNKVVDTARPKISFPGRSFSGRSCFSLDERMLARHLLLLGASGSGKTNAFFYILDQLRRDITEDDVLIIFDTKGEFYEAFSRPGDYIIGNGERFRNISCTWNLFDEVLADGSGKANIEMNAREISYALFKDRGSQSQPFFCEAARDIFRALIVYFIRSAQHYPERCGSWLNNEDLIKAMHKFKAQEYIKIFNSFTDMRYLLSYIGDGTSNQALGVLGELNSMRSTYFDGIMARHIPERSISMRNAVRARGGKAIFVEYDLSVGETLSPVYRLLVDQALKEALCRKSGRGNVYLIADEFKLLPKLEHIDDALNFGRGLGIKVMAGIQSTDQIYDIYGKEKGSVLLSGFGSVFGFFSNDASSREYISKRYGANLSAYDYIDRNSQRQIVREREGSTVEDWDQMNLGVGQAVVGLASNPPFIFQFDEYGKKAELWQNARLLR